MSKRFDTPQLIVRHHDPRSEQRRQWLWLLAWLVSVVLAFVVGSMLANPPDAVRARQDKMTLEKSIAGLRKELTDAAQIRANLERGNQILQTANADLQQSLTAREDEINRLRTDNGFYERLVGGNARQGLTLHEFRARPAPQSKDTWLFDLTVLQNLKKGANVNGQFDIAVEGQREGKLTTLKWKDIAAQGGEAPKFSFKYFQHVAGSFMLPPDFVPTRVLVKAQADTGERINTSLAWQDVLKSGG